MNRLKDLSSTSLTQDLIASANEAYSLTASNKIPFHKSIQHKKLENYKKTLKSLQSLKASLNTCNTLQLQSIESIQTLSSHSTSLSTSLKSFISPILTCESLRSSSSIIQSILSYFNSNPSQCTFQSLLENLSNLDLIQEEISSGHLNADYKLKIVKAEQNMLNELTRKIQKSLLDMENTEKPSQLKYALDLINKKKPGDYQGILNNLIQYRKKKAFIEVNRVKKQDFVKFLEELVRITLREQQVLQVVLGNDAEGVNKEVFQGFYQEAFEWFRPELSSLNLFELFSCLDSLSAVKDLLYVNDIKTHFELQIEILTKQTLNNISSLSMINDSRIPYYFHIKVAELLLTQNSIKNSAVFEYFSQVLIEVLDKSLGYFFDLSTIRSCVLALNVYELVFHTFHKFYAFSLSESIQELQNQIISLEVQRLLDIIQGFSQDFSHSFINFYYKILHSSVLSPEIKKILSQTSQKFVIRGISDNLLHKISQKVLINHSNLLLNPSILNILLSYNE